MFYKLLLTPFQALSWISLLWGILRVLSMTVSVTDGNEEGIYELGYDSSCFWRSPSPDGASQLIPKLSPGEQIWASSTHVRVLPLEAGCAILPGAFWQASHAELLWGGS